MKLQIPELTPQNRDPAESVAGFLSIQTRIGQAEEQQKQ